MPKAIRTGMTHSETGMTHYACQSRIEKEGGKSLCCGCAPHEPCDYKKQPPEWEELLKGLLNEMFGIDFSTPVNEGRFILIRAVVRRELEKNFKAGLQKAVDMGELSLETIEEIKKEIKKSGN